jgi:hypothetical protein
VTSSILVSSRAIIFLIWRLCRKAKDLYAIRIEYGRNKAATMRQVFHQVLPPKTYAIGLLLDAKIIGYVAREAASRADVFLMATNMTTNIYVRSKTRMPIVSGPILL